MLFINNVEGLFKNHYRPLCLYATHFIGDIDMAEDIVMDCFVKYAELLNNGEKIKLHKSYLYQMVRNGCIDQLRSKIQTFNVETIPDYPDV